MKTNGFLEGLRDGFPIGLGYFAVAFSLGIVAKNASLTPVQGFIASFLNVASAGEYALFTSIQNGSSIAEIAIITLVVNARYLLMSCAVAQKFSSRTPFFHRFLVGFGITDEIFAITVGRRGFVEPSYNYGAIIAAVPLWSIGTSLGILAGNILPLRVVSALSVALYGMFLAIIIPPARKDFVILVTVLVSFALSFASSKLPFVKEISSGSRTIILTLVITSLVALIKPVKEEVDADNPENMITAEECDIAGGNSNADKPEENVSLENRNTAGAKGITNTAENTPSPEEESL